MFIPKTRKLENKSLQELKPLQQKLHSPKIE